MSLRKKYGTSSSYLKHLDFIISDFIMLEISYILGMHYIDQDGSFRTDSDGIGKNGIECALQRNTIYILNTITQSRTSYYI